MELHEIASCLLLLDDIALPDYRRRRFQMAQQSEGGHAIRTLQRIEAATWTRVVAEVAPSPALKAGMQCTRRIRQESEATESAADFQIREAGGRCSPQFRVRDSQQVRACAAGRACGQQQRRHRLAWLHRLQHRVRRPCVQVNSRAGHRRPPYH